MVPLDYIDLVEERYTAGAGPSLGRAYALLQKRWTEGGTDLETGLRLMFLAWYSGYRPPVGTGLPREDSTWQVFRQVFEHFGGETSDEPELLFAVGHMVSVLPWCLGDEQEGQAVGRNCLARIRAMLPDGFPAEHFAGRGAYGQYFESLLKKKQKEG
jgi:hypothetical protein